MTDPVLLVLFALFAAWWGATAVLALKVASEIRARVGEAPEDLRGIVRSTSARHASHALLRLGLIAALLDVVIGGEVDWAAPLMLTTFVLFIGASLWNAFGYSRHRGDRRVQQWTRIGDVKEEDDMTGHDEMASEPYDDPGWLPAFKRVGIGRLRAMKEVGVDGVVVTRLLFLSLLMPPLLLLFVLTFVIEAVGIPNAAIGSVVVILGIAGVAAAAWTANRKLDISNPSALAVSYRTNFFLGFALNEAPLLLSFVFCFIREELWPYLVALPLYLIGMALIAPSRRNLERRQAQIHGQGSMLSLGRALSSLPGKARG